MRRSPETARATFMLITAFIVFIIIVMAALPVAKHSTQETVQLTVRDKERVTQTSSEGGVSSKYLVYTDGEVFENTDSLLNGKFDSSDVYGRLKRDQSYRCKVEGWRIPVFSMYRNILSCDPA